jgi:Animal haem peroxidase
MIASRTIEPLRSGGTAVSPAPALAPERPKHHGSLIRGADLIPRSDFAEGRFGRMFRTLHPARHSDAELIQLGSLMTADADPGTPEDQADDEENVGTQTDPGISAGYTYLGQFIDHDLTFDPNSSLQKQNDPDALEDFRTPRFDLDNVYGRGPDDQPYLYRSDGLRLLQGEPLTGNADGSPARDLPRNSPAPDEPARALIGDPRNDENVLVSQLQGMFTRFHNRMVDFLQARDGSTTFEEAQRLVRWHYQWVVLHDFLPTIAGKEMVASVLPDMRDEGSTLKQAPVLNHYRVKKSAFMPVEFSVAAYRFGHSMVRPIYRLSTSLPVRFQIFSSDPNTSLTGFRAFPRNWAIDWPLFFQHGKSSTNGPGRVQPAYKIDTSLVNPLGSLPPSVGGSLPSLPQRNLLRGMRMELPSGQTVARHLGIQPIPDDKLKVGKATEATAASNPTLASISPSFRDHAPLWFYILAEAQQSFVKNDTPIRLGPVGGRIVTEVFVGLMWEDRHSYLRQKPEFKPLDEFLINGEFNMAALLTQAAKA